MDTEEGRVKLEAVSPMAPSRRTWLVREKVGRVIRRAGRDLQNGQVRKSVPGER